MINSVSMSSMSTMGTSSMQRQPPPQDKDVFQVADSDSSGLVSSTELETLAAGIEELTGNSIDVEETLATYDADGDGGLSGEELFGLLSSQGFNPGGMVSGESSDSEMMPPPPPPPQQASSAYEANSGEDTISQLIELLTGNSESEVTYSSLEATA
ncbi:EF hand [Desulfuromusa kysingii]|uniref:EF hand n=1 Tax=Desulfuromusa kysingii TaxID=37625 RepID=A0A1H3W7C8_9BACT|nr:EF-hand domain-containing protein [Desulfuromusa kysingii]SDZ83003.1 EF hand [Desulfuromusa kysingii]